MLKSPRIQRVKIYEEWGQVAAEAIGVPYAQGVATVSYPTPVAASDRVDQGPWENPLKGGMVAHCTQTGVWPRPAFKGTMG